jgi:hypothetical protein
MKISDDLLRGQLPIPEDDQSQEYANRAAVIELAKSNYAPPHPYSPLGRWLYTYANNIFLREFY